LPKYFRSSYVGNIQTQHSQETSRNFLFGMEHDCLSGMSSTTHSH
jgi:hypothetical protein